MTMDRFTADFDRIFADGPTPEYSQCFCKGPQGRQRECPCALAQKGFEGSEAVRAAASRFTALDKSAAATRTATTEGENHG